jgi:activator of HSP90 ATPase
MKHRIHQELVLAAAPTTVYDVLTDAKRFSAMSGGAPTDIDASPGGAFSCFGGMITGRNLECSRGEHLVQAWRAKTWEPGVYSVVQFRLQDEDGKTRLIMDHTGFPDEQGEHLEQGWHANYWKPMEALLA